MMNILLYKIIVYSITRKIWTKSCENNKFKISGPTWNEKFELPDVSNYVWDIQDYFEDITKIMKKWLIIL